MTAKSFGVDIDPPPGTIAIWANSISDIPEGWALCDGNTTGVPDMTDRFLRSVPDSATDPGTTGGQNSYSLSTGQLPSHNHGGGSVSGGSHSHSIGYWKTNKSGTDGYYSLQGTEGDKVGPSGSHSHGLNLNNTGSGSSIDNRPHSYTVAFIQKL